MRDCTTEAIGSYSKFNLKCTFDAPLTDLNCALNNLLYYFI